MDSGPTSNNGGGRAVAGDGTGAPAPPKPARAPRKRDPKLDLDLLETEGGFNDVYHKIAPAFKASFQGEGHEVADLRRLLELYQRWQARFFPYCDFDTFVLKLEKAGRSKAVKAKLGEMRQELLGCVFPEEVEGAPDEGERRTAAAAPPPAGATPAPAGAAAAARPAAHPAAKPAAPAAAAAAAPAPMDEWDDDELVAMQRDQEWEAANEVMDEMEAQPAVRPQQQPQEAQPAGATVGPGAMDVDDDELLLMAADAYQEDAQAHHEMQKPQQQQQQQQQASSQEAQAPGSRGLPTGTGLAGTQAIDDEELLAMAAEHGSGGGGGAPGPSQSQFQGQGGKKAGTGQSVELEEDLDEELRRLEAMGTAEAEAAVGLRPTGHSGAEGGASQRQPAHGSGEAEGGSSAMNLDDELRGLATFGGAAAGGTQVMEAAGSAGAHGSNGEGRPASSLEAGDAADGVHGSVAGASAACAGSQPPQEGGAGSQEEDPEQLARGFLLSPTQ